MKDRHEPVAIIVPYSIALNLTEGMRTAYELFRDVGLDCTCIAGRYVRSAMLAAERVHSLRNRRAS
ncbi:hypothetical protein [Catelliglobosispora koreensis]|uniref:hypothetical protein n=1 Tax=Catelliglobosispora koreensis TaxID=129052 RepID=UPI00036EB5D3|nr:hypothetical protein [Catelliglobosispora koreensis]